MKNYQLRRWSDRKGYMVPVWSESEGANFSAPALKSLFFQAIERRTILEPGAVFDIREREGRSVITLAKSDPRHGVRYRQRTPR